MVACEKCAEATPALARPVTSKVTNAKGIATTVTTTSAARIGAPTTPAAPTQGNQIHGSIRAQTTATANGVWTNAT